MELTKSSLKFEIEAIAKAPQFDISSMYDVYVHVSDSVKVKALYVLWVQSYSNYTNAFAEEMIIAASFPEGDYQFDIYPNRDNLKISLQEKKARLNAQVAKVSEDNGEQTTLYKGKLLGVSSEQLEQNFPGSQNKQRLNDTRSIEVKIQLIHPIIDYLRKTSTGGVFTDVLSINAIRAVLGSFTQEAALAVGFNFAGVDVAAGYDTQVKSSIMIRDDVFLINIPKLINEESGGVYPTGFWYHFHRQHWYVYPKFDLERYYNHTGLRLRVINVPAGKFPDSPKTFRINDNLLTVLATDQVKQLDLSAVDKENKGNATRFVDPSKLFDEYITVDGNKAIADAAKVVSEVTLDPNADGSNYIALSDTPITSRYNIEYSKLAARNGMLIQFIWENAGPELIYPGMPCSYVYLEHEQTVVELTGVVTSVEWQAQTKTIDVNNRTFIKRAAIQLFVGRGLSNKPISTASGGASNLGQ